MLLLSQALMRSDSLAQVPPLLENAETIYLDTYGADHTKLSFLEFVTGEYRLANGDPNGARQVLMSAYRHRLEEYNQENLLILGPLLALVKTELAAANVTEARQWLDRASASLARLQDSHPERIEALVLGAELLSAEGRDAEATSAKAEVGALIEEHFPKRADWRRRIEAI
jgi:hypothetical protein